MPRVFNKRPMFFALEASPSFVDIAITTGKLLRRVDFAARETVLSLMALAIFAAVVPEQGAITSASIIFWGPMGSTSV